MSGNVRTLCKYLSLKQKVITLLIISVLSGCNSSTTATESPESAISHPGSFSNKSIIIDPKTNLLTTPSAHVSIDVKDLATGQPVYFRAQIQDHTGHKPGSLKGNYGFAAHSKIKQAVASGPVEIKINGGRRRIGTQKVVNVGALGTKRIKIKMGMPSELNFESQGWTGVDLFRPLLGPNTLNTLPNYEMAQMLAGAEKIALMGLAQPWENTPPKEGVCSTNQGATYITRAFISKSAPFYGEMFFLGTDEPLKATPLLFRPEWPNFKTITEVKKQGGVAIYKSLAQEKLLDPKYDILLTHPALKPFYKNTTSAIGGIPPELPFDLLAGIPPDAIGIAPKDEAFEIWFDLLNAGYRIPTVLVETKSISEGAMPKERVFIKRDRPTDTQVLPGEVARAIRRGRFMSSNGPFAFLSIDGQEPGSVILAEGKEQIILLQAFASTKMGVKIQRVELIRNGQIIETIYGQNRKQISGRLKIKEKESSWYILRVYSSLDGGAISWTAPIYFEHPNYKKNITTTTNVTGRVVDAKTARPINAKVEAYLAGELTASTTSNATTGFYSLRCSPAATIEVKAAGFEAINKDVFFATDALYEILDIHKNATGRGARAISDEATFKKLRAATKNARLSFRLTPTPHRESPKLMPLVR